MFLVWLLVAVFPLGVTVKALTKKAELNERYWKSLGEGIRRWEQGPILDARQAVSEELGWTILLVAAWCSAIVAGILFCQGVVDLLS